MAYSSQLYDLSIYFKGESVALFPWISPFLGNKLSILSVYYRNRPGSRCKELSVSLVE